MAVMDFIAGRAGWIVLAILLIMYADKIIDAGFKVYKKWKKTKKEIEQEHKEDKN